MKKSYDMTKGKIWTTILSFSLPLLGASLTLILNQLPMFIQ